MLLQCSPLFKFKQSLVTAGDEHNRRGDEALAGVDNIQKVVEDV